MGAILAKFSTTPSSKTIDGTQKSFDLKWWHGPPLSPCKIWWKSRDARRRERMKCNVFHFFNYFFVNNARRPSTALVHSWVTSKRHSICWHLLADLDDILTFFAEEKPFQTIEHIWKFSLEGATIGARMANFFLKIWENGCKVCAHHFDHLEARWKKISTTALYLIL